MKLNIEFSFKQKMMLNHTIISSQQKIAEKLTILNDRGIGMLTRISNIKKVKYV